MILDQRAVCEIAWVTLDEDLNILDQHCTYVDPGRPIEPGAFAVHGISDEMCVGKPKLAEVARLLPEKGYMTAHNCAFDARMISAVYTPAATLCTLALSRKYIKGTTNHKLATLQQELGLPVRQSHSALGDILTVHDLLKHILPLAGVGLEALFTRAKAPKLLHTMPFGKHRGAKFLDVPVDYRNWLLGQPSLDQDLKYTLEKLQNV